MHSKSHFYYLSNGPDTRNVTIPRSKVVSKFIKDIRVIKMVWDSSYVVVQMMFSEKHTSWSWGSIFSIWSFELFTRGVVFIDIDYDAICGSISSIWSFDSLLIGYLCLIWEIGTRDVLEVLVASKEKKVWILKETSIFKGGWLQELGRILSGCFGVKNFLPHK